MAFGNDMVALIKDLVAGQFGTTVSWKRITRTEQEDGSVTETSTTYEGVRIALTRAVSLAKDFGEDAVVTAESAFVIPTSQCAWDTTGATIPNQFDEITLPNGNVLKVALPVVTRLVPGGLVAGFAGLLKR